MTGLDAHGQPNLAFNRGRRIERATAEMLGIVKGVLADGVVSESEASALMQWVNANPDVSGDWPGRIIVARLHRIFEDMRIDGEELADLRDLLRKVSGEDSALLVGENAAPRWTAHPVHHLRSREY